MHDGMQYDLIQGQGHEPFKVWNPFIFRSYLLYRMKFCSGYGYNESTVNIDIGIIRSTLLSRPDEVGLKFLSFHPSVRPFVRPQKVSSISVKFGT